MDLPAGGGTLTIPDGGRYALMPAATDAVIDELLVAARNVLGQTGVGWMAADGGLLSNLPAWENVLLSTQWHAPAALSSLEARLGAWMVHLGHDAASTRRLLSRQPSRLGEDERRVVGWLRLLLSRPKLVLLAGMALPDGATGQRIMALLDEELPGSALVVVDDDAPAWFTPLSIRHAEATSP